MSPQVITAVRPSAIRSLDRGYERPSRSGTAYDYLLEGYSALHSLLANSLQTQAGALPTADECREIGDAYLGLPRYIELVGSDDQERLGADQFEMKLAMSHWRDQTKRTLLHGLESGALSDSSVVAALQALKEVRVQLHPAELQQLAMGRLHGARGSAIVRALTSLIASQGALGPARAAILEGAPEEVRLEAGPVIFPDMWAERTADVPFSKWASNPVYSNYQNLTAKTVDFRGISIRSGDILIVDEARAVAGFMPSLFTPRQNTNHFGILVILPFQKRWVPVVFDFADTFRIVPLNLFLSERFCTNAYVLRHKEMDDAKTLAAAQIVKSYHDRGNLAFNMEAEEGRDIAEGMTCGTFVLDYFKRQGLTWPGSRSRIAGEKLLTNLKAVSFFSTQAFAPVNLLQSPAVDLIGVIDNGHLGTVVTRSVINYYFRRLMREKTLRVERFPRIYKQTVCMIERMQSDSIRGYLARKVFARDHSADTFPKGAAETLAAYRLHFATLRRAEEKTILLERCEHSLAKFVSEHEVFSIHDFESAPGPFQKTLRSSFRPVERSFE